MSGDVQPRKRKDKKKKRDDESSHGVHVTKMGSDDVLLHVHEDHGTGGHWCAKIIFFSLMTILMGLVCLIILENRGISDVDTPLSESRFSNYFDGWVDEHRAEHDDHHDSHGSVEHDDHNEDDGHDDEDDHGEPFEEEADHSEGDEEVAEDEDDNVTPEEEEEGEDGDNATQENLTVEEEAVEDDDEEEGEEEDDEEDNVTAEEADDNDENVTAEDENVTQEATNEQNEDDDNDDGDGDNDDNKTNEEDNEDDNATKETSKPTSQATHDDDDDDPFDEDDDDGTFDSLEKIVDNDAAELELLKEKARQQAAAESKQNVASAENDVEDQADNAPSWASSQIKPKTSGGPQSLEDDEIDLFESELRRANDEMMRENYANALKSFDRLIQKYPKQPQVYLGKAQTLDHYAEQRKSNHLLMEAIEMYNIYLEFNVKDNQLLEYRSAAERCVERMRFLGKFQQCLPVHYRLIEKFSQEPFVRNQLVITLLMLDRLLDAKQILQETLQLWPKNGLALVHYGFVLKQLDQDYYNASIYLRQGIETKAEGTQDGRFYFHLGEALQRLEKQNEAVEVFRKGADLKFFPSVYQRSLYNEANLKVQPFWSLEETTYGKFLKKIQDNWLAVQAEGLNILGKTGYFLDESENLKNKGDWKQFELYARGQRRRDNCLKAPITCSFIEEFPASRDCRRGQVKFSVMHAGTHIWPHCGPTNCRLRAHLGLVVPNGTRIRVAEEVRSWQEGKFLIFDDSFEHEVWHEGHSLRLVLIVDVWHPQLTEQQRQSLTAI